MINCTVKLSLRSEHLKIYLSWVDRLLPLWADTELFCVVCIKIRISDQPG